ELKAYAHTTPAARNAAVEFDLETLSPTYRLTIGLPGGSQAFAIAERLGLPEAIVTEARSRLSESQRSFEATLASIKATEGETSEALDRARAAESRASEALLAAQEERRRARRERDEAVSTARAEAERIVEGLRTEVRTSREALERQTVTAPALDEALTRAEGELARLPAEDAAPPPPEPIEARSWRLGERARSRSGGWEGRIAALERGGKRATLEAGGMRVTVDVDDLVPSVGDAGSGRRGDGVGAETSSAAGELGLERARSVASSLDLRGARVDEALEALDRYLDDAGLAGLDKVLIIHGMGTGAVRDAVRAAANAHPLVKSMRPGQRGEGGDGATIVEF
ncbi:MAG: mismatch repair protein MutS2, partial [Chloroflexota bacterium]|nr:mismatch repair protein MutS2 [Chloroflexota bacterium]